jgi:hypothetical protein
MGVEEDILELKKELEAFGAEAMKCKLDVYNRVRNLSEAIDNQAIDRAKNQSILEKNQQRLEEKLDNIQDSHTKLDIAFTHHTEEEMGNILHMTKAIEATAENVNKLTETIDKLITDTDRNTSIINQQEEQDKIARIKKEAIDEHDAPWKDYRNKAIGVVVVMITGALVTGIWKLIVFVSNIDSLLKGG